MIGFELEPEHEQARQQIFSSWDHEKQITRDSMSLAEMLSAFEACYWVEERSYQRIKSRNERKRKAKI